MILSVPRSFTVFAMVSAMCVSASFHVTRFHSPGPSSGRAPRSRIIGYRARASLWTKPHA